MTLMATIHLNQNSEIVKVDERRMTGLKVWGDWGRVAKGLMQSGWGGGLRPDEYVSAIEISEKGLTLTFESKTLTKT